MASMYTISQLYQIIRFNKHIISIMYLLYLLCSCWILKHLCCDWG